MEENSRSRMRNKIHQIIFEADTKAGKLFDVILMGCIVTSVIVVALDSVESIQQQYGRLIYILEWVFTILFTIEYILRIISVKKISGYVFSFYGLVDLFSILPTYISLLLPGSQYFLVIRILRVLRIFRVLKFSQYLSEADQLKRALANSRRKIFVFVFTVITISIIVGSMMYLIEGPENGFTSIPRGVYWAVVTLTTVGYGDISPGTPIGQMFSIFIMILGYGIIAVPTGIVTVELSKSKESRQNTQFCQYCSREGHDYDAAFCKYCGNSLTK